LRLFLRGLVALCAGLLALTPAVAGPPYETDDPAPTDTGHWEIYAFTGLEGRGSNFDGSAGLDLNYGPIKGVQLTTTLPVDYAHGRGSGWRSGAGVVEIGVKYRFVDLAAESQQAIRGLRFTPGAISKTLMDDYSAEVLPKGKAAAA
jgi:hypothetical protein